MRAMWHDHEPPRPSHQRTRIAPTESARHALSPLPSPSTRLPPADPHLMESRMRGQRACPVWGEGGRKPHGGIHVWRLRPYSTPLRAALRSDATAHYGRPATLTDTRGGLEGAYPGILHVSFSSPLKEVAKEVVQEGTVELLTDGVKESL